VLANLTTYTGSYTAADKYLECTAGYYCPEGTSDLTTQVCPEGYYCPAGSNSPIPCTGGHYCAAGIDEAGIVACDAGWVCDYYTDSNTDSSGDYCVEWDHDGDLNVDCIRGQGEDY
jgi:hypothetical protein